MQFAHAKITNQCWWNNPATEISACVLTKSFLQHSLKRFIDACLTQFTLDS